MPRTGWAQAACVALVAANLFVLHAKDFGDETSALPSSATITNTAQLRQLVPDPAGLYSVRLDGTVLWANAFQGRLVLMDETGVAELGVTLAGGDLAVGDLVRVEGKCTIINRAGRSVLVPHGPVVDNDGIHSAVERVGTVYLEAGLQPFCLLWFNGQDQLELTVEVEGPNLVRRQIPAGMLFRPVDKHETTSTNVEPGVWYECFDALEETLPDFDSLVPIKSGYTENFDLHILPRTNQIALRFTGYLHAPQTGLYRFFLRSDDGSKLFVGRPTVTVTVVGTNSLPMPKQVLAGQVLTAAEEMFWAETEGRIRLVRQQPGVTQIELTAGVARLDLELTGQLPGETRHLLGQRIRAIGVCRSTITADGQRLPGKLLVTGTNQIAFFPPTQPERTHQPERGAALPMLQTAVDVHKLKRDAAQRRYPVRLDGVVTCVLPEHQAFTVQDSTRGIYVVDMTRSGHGLPEVGEHVQVEGVTDPSLFAPVVNATRIISGGLGQLPEPVRPTFDQLLNGSMDAQYVQIQGIVTETRSNTVVLHMRDGSIEVELRPNNIAVAALPTLQDALVRVRGCLFASWDYVTHQVKPGEIRLYNADIFVDEPAPADIFATAAKKVSELLQFDPLAGAFQRVKVEGQVVASAGQVIFMMQGGVGMRFVCRTNLVLQPGDKVEVVGFPDVVAACSPTLRGAVVRKTGHEHLPQPRKLAPGELGDPVNDATRVRVEAMLVSVAGGTGGQTLELQAGMRTFIARPAQGMLLPRNLAQGSRLDVTGVYVAQGPAALPSRQVPAFELLITAPGDINVLARPPWWTLERLLIVIGVLLCVLCLAALWITLLHRKVEQRTAELTAQIHERQRAEHRQWLERERTRIAQDLHDELGSGITEISMLALRAGTNDAPTEKRVLYLEQIRARATELVTALDEIVWATNPQHDSLASLVSYLSLYADRFLAAANIQCQVEQGQQMTDRSVASHMRHTLFMAFREALNNVVKHARATRVTIRFALADSVLQIAVIDNGCGMAGAPANLAGEGLTNMRSRVEKLGGKFNLQSAPGKGTQIEFVVPISSPNV